MYYTTESQLLFIQHMNSKTPQRKMSEIFGQSRSALTARASKINSILKLMYSLRITEEQIVDTIIELNGDIYLILKKLKIRKHLLMAILNSMPEIHCKINGNNQLWNYFSSLQTYGNVNVKTVKTTSSITQFVAPKNKQKLVTISDSTIPTERNYLKQAEEILQGRLTRHPKLGRLLDGEMKSVKQILEAAGITDPALYA